MGKGLCIEEMATIWPEQKLEKIIKSSGSFACTKKPEVRAR